MPPRQIRTRDGPSPAAHGGQPRPPEAEWWIKPPARGWRDRTKTRQVAFLLLAVGGAVLAFESAAPGIAGPRPELMLSLAAFGVLVGWAGAMQRRGALAVHLAGSLIAGLIIPFVMILAIGETDLSVAVRKVSTDIGDGVANALRSGVPGSTPSRTLFVHAVVIWSVAQFAAFALVGHRRARAAVGAPLALAFGTAIFGDGQVGAELALTSVGALLVLVEHHALESQTIWARRRLGDGSITARRQRRSGAPYAIIAVVCATAMAGVLRVDPLAGLWRDAAGLRDLMSTVGGMVPMPRSATGDDGSFDAVAFGLVDVWQPGDGIALRATVAAGLDGPWRATTFDRFAGDGWLQSQGRSVEVGAGESLIGSGDISAMDATTTVTVRPEHYRDATLVSPGVALTADVRATLGMLDAAGMVERIRRDQGGAEYTVTVGSRSLREQGITRQRLRDAGRAYPVGVVAAYTQLDAAALGPAAIALRDEIIGTSAGADPYDIAVAFERFLSTDPRFEYTTDLRGLGCDLGPIDCFARTGKGFCVQYATTMAVLLRSLDEPIPTRLVMGFLPGTRRDGVETVQMAGKHAWVEVYFPGTGWVSFDPTGRGASSTGGLSPGVAPSSPLPSHDPETPATPAARPPGARQRSASPPCAGRLAHDPSGGAGCRARARLDRGPSDPPTAIARPRHTRVRVALDRRDGPAVRTRTFARSDRLRVRRLARLDRAGRVTGPRDDRRGARRGGLRPPRRRPRSARRGPCCRRARPAAPETAPAATRAQATLVRSMPTIRRRPSGATRVAARAAWRARRPRPRRAARAKPPAPRRSR